MGEESRGKRFGEAVEREVVSPVRAGEDVREIGG